MTTVKFKGTEVQLSGDVPAVGEKAPKFGGVRADLSVLHLPDLQGRRVVLNIFPDRKSVV